MQCLLLTEDLHQGEFVHQGFKYESLPINTLSVYTPPEKLIEAFWGSDIVFILVHNLNFLDNLLPAINLPHRTLPVIVLAQHYDQKLAGYLQKQKIQHFFTRPFAFRTIANEVRTMVYLQREQSTYQVLKIRELELNRDTHEVRWQGRPIQLRHKEFVLLEFLMLNAGKLLSRETILESVWDRNANIFTNTVDVHINKLRKKIDYNVSEKFIHTVHCSGYIFS